MIPMALKVILLLGALSVPVGNHVRRDHAPIDPLDVGSRHLCFKAPAGHRDGAVLGSGVALDESASWLAAARDDESVEDVASVSLTGTLGRPVTRPWFSCASRAISPIHARLASGRNPLRC
jgi:hypothetical protein